MNRESISANQVMSIVASSLIGVSILSLPSDIARVAAQDAWVCFLLGGAGTALLLYVTTALTARFPGRTLSEYSRDLLGPRAGRAAAFVFGAAELASASAIVRVFSEAVTGTVLTEAPHEPVCAAMWLLVFYLCLQRVRVFARVHELFVGPIVVIFALFIVMVFRNAYPANLAPVLAGGLRPVLAGAVKTSLAFQGFEIMLLFFGYAENPATNLRASMAGLGLVGVMYVAAVAGVTAVFGPEHLKSLQWPLMEAIRVVGVSQAIGMERVEALFITVWMIAAFTSAGALGYAGVRSLGDSVGWRDPFVTAPVLMPVAYAASLAPGNLFAALEVSTIFGQGVLAYTTILAVGLVLVAVARRKRGDDGAAGRGKG